MLFQRSRAKWLIDGDRNTRYYHLKVVTRRRRNNILMLRDEEGQWIDDTSRLKGMVNDFYKKLFTKDHVSSEWISTNITYPTLDGEIMGKLASPIDDEEVKRAMFNMSPWKAPGLDGFPAGLFQQSWDIVGRSTCDFVKDVWINPSRIAEVNQTDICLIPKINNPEFVNQFRPISLCNTIYKVVSKVVVERLKEYIPCLVSPFQTGFVPGRSIHENIVVAQELVHSMNKMTGKKGYFVIKVDLAKAYDMISWDFISRILSEINFPEALINVIIHSVTNVESNVKWNGAREDYFRPQRGIRQGEPISPYLFVLCMDKLSHMILHEVNQGKWKSIKVGRRGPEVSHLMFADDLLLFGEATEIQMQCATHILHQFCMLSGQRISNEKTNMFFSKNVSRGMREVLVQLSRFRKTHSLGKYLGVPLLGRAPRKEDFQYIIDQLNSKLAGWKANHLSFAGRVTLVKSVIEAVPIYPMMTTYIPKRCIDEMQRIQRSFVWGDTDTTRRHHAISWDIVTQPKCYGGLGLRKLDIMNKACIMKLCWGVFSVEKSLWSEILRGKYQRNCDLIVGMIARNSDSSLWKNMVKFWPDIITNCFWSIGNGQNIDAW